MNQSHTKQKGIRHWINRALFNTDSVNQYFEALTTGIDPMWSLTDIKAKVEAANLETHDMLTLTLKPSTGFEEFQAGQHIQLSVEKNGVRKTRTFSLSSSPSELRSLGQVQVTIKAIENGDVTPWIHTHIKPGNVVTLSQAQGSFTLPDNEYGDTLYIAGGSGITPIMSHIRELSLTNPNAQLTLLYYAKSKNDFAFQSELEALSKHMKNFKLYCIETRGISSTKLLSGHLSSEHIQRACKDEPGHIYLCGPSSLKAAARECVEKLYGQSKHIFQEDFGLEITSKMAGGTAQPVTLENTNLTFNCEPTTPLLDAVEQNGLKPNHGCRMGICYTCKCKKKSGVVRNLVTGQLSDNSEEDIQLCVSVPETPVTLEL